MRGGSGADATEIPGAATLRRRPPMPSRDGIGLDRGAVGQGELGRADGLIAASALGQCTSAACGRTARSAGGDGDGANAPTISLLIEASLTTHQGQNKLNKTCTWACRRAGSSVPALANPICGSMTA